MEKVAISNSARLNARTSDMLRFPSWFYLGPSLYLFVLPFSSTAALRSIALALILVVFTLGWVKMFRQSERMPAIPVWLGFVVWGLAALNSIPGSIDFSNSLDEFKGDYLYSLLVFSTCLMLTTNARIFRLFRFVVMLSLAVVSLLAIMSYLRNFWWAQGYFNQLGEYATFNITLLPLVITALFPSNLSGQIAADKNEFCLALFTCMLVGFGLFFTLSRGVWITVAVTVLAFISYAAYARALHKKIVIFFSVLVLITVGGMVFHVSSLRNTEATSLHGREAIYSIAYETFANHPFTGTGYGRENNSKAYRVLNNEKEEHNLARHAHNIILSWAEQMGIWGIAAFFVLFFTMIRSFLAGYCRAKTNKEAGLLAVTGVTVVTVVLLKNMVDMFFANETLIAFFAVCGVLLGYLTHLFDDKRAVEESAQ